MSRTADNWILHSPRIWLGSVFHQLMSKAPLDQKEAENLWDMGVAEILVSITNHRLDRRFADRDRWPGYYLVRQRAIASAVRGTRAITQVPLRPQFDKFIPRGSERQLTARGGRLAGRPDHFDLNIVTEYKSSLPDPSWSEAAGVIDGYWRQLWLYAVLISEIGNWPTTARIVSATGQVLDRPIDQKICDAEADAAIAGMENMNQAIEAGCMSTSLANPSQIACGQCPYKAICPAFWAWCESASWPALRKPAARGTLESVEQGMDGDLYTVTVNLEGRHGFWKNQSIAFKKTVHGDLKNGIKGSSIRIVSALLRPDGRLRADISTCVFEEEEIPEVHCRSNA